MKDLILELAAGLRAEVLPMLGARASRAHVQTGAGGDVTFAIDAAAEQFLESFLAERAPGIAFYSEDRGLVVPAGEADTVLIVDPIDGTRPALAGLEAACVSIAAAPFDPAATMADVTVGCVAEIKTGTVFLAQRGAGVEIRAADGGSIAPDLSDNSDLSRLFWTFGFRGRPAAPLIEVLGDLIDASSVGGGVFNLGSASFDMTRILTGQLDAHVDVGTHMIDAFPELREEFERVGGGAVLNNSPYDLAAAVVCLSEAGATVTDAAGLPLDGRPMLGTGHSFQMSCVAAANRELHAQILEQLERGLAALARRLS